MIATLLAEAWPVLRARDYPHLRRLAGVAPVTRQTGTQGKRKGTQPLIVMRRACNEHLRMALWYWAGNAWVKDEYWRAQYATLRARGTGEALARRILGDRLLRVACACLRDGTAYDNKRHAAKAA